MEITKFQTDSGHWQMARIEDWSDIVPSHKNKDRGTKLSKLRRNKFGISRGGKQMGGISVYSVIVFNIGRF